MRRTRTISGTVTAVVIGLIGGLATTPTASAATAKGISTDDFTVKWAHETGCSNNFMAKSITVRLEIQNHSRQSIQSTITFRKLDGAASTDFEPLTEDSTLTLRYRYEVGHKPARYPDNGTGKVRIEFAIGGQDVSFPLMVTHCPIHLP